MTASTLKKLPLPPDEDCFTSRHSSLLSLCRPLLSLPDCSRGHSFKVKTPHVSTFKNGSTTHRPKLLLRNSLKQTPLPLPSHDFECATDYYPLSHRAMSPTSSFSSSFHNSKSASGSKTQRNTLKKSGTQPHLTLSFHSKSKKKRLSRSTFHSPGVAFTHPDSLPRIESPIRCGSKIVTNIQ